MGMKYLCCLLSVFILMVIAMPYHGMDSCDHEQETEQHAGEHPINSCCPPFSFCKTCSWFTDTRIAVTLVCKQRISIPYYTDSYVDLFWQDVALVFWHPPKIS